MTDPIRIMRVIARLNVGGPAVHVILLTDHLTSPDYESTLVCGQIGPHEGDMTYLAEKRGITPIIIPELGRELSPLRDLRTLFKLWRLMRKLHPDVVHTHTAKAGFVGRWAAWLAGVPVRVHTFHGHVFHGYFSPRKTQVFLWLERLTALLTDRLITISPALKDELANDYRIAPVDKFEVVPLGLDLQPFADTPRHQGNFRAEYDIPADAPLIGIVGRLVPIKNHELFLAMAEIVHSTRPDARFVIIGDGERRSEIEALAKDLPVIFTGWQKDLRPTYSDMDVLVISSNNEGTPVSLIEALAAGVPVVSTSVGGVPDLLHNGDWGRLVPPGDAPTLADAVLESINKPQDNTIQQAVVEQYGINRLAGDLSALYQRLLKSKQRPKVNAWQRFGIGLCLTIFLMALYFFTFNGYAISRDEWFLFDATESMAYRGDLTIHYEYDAYQPISMESVVPRPADTEPLQPVLAAPLVLAAQRIPDIGMIHTVWLFNILITALTAGTLYAYGLALGYRIRTAVIVALIFGTGTIAWPYSRTFFREPLFTWLALLSAYCVMRLRQQVSARKNPLLPIVGGALAFTGAVLSKEASLLFVPVLIIEAIPSQLGRIRLSWRAVVGIGGLFVAAVALLILVSNLDTWFGVDLNRYSLTQRIDQAQTNLTDASTGIRGYLFSPARSVWVFSPVLLLGVIGLPDQVRQRRFRQIAVPLVMLVSFILGYAIVRGPEWYGGTGWGSRYLVPVTPFVAIWLFPVIEGLFHAALWKRISAAVVVAVSIGVQWLGMLIPVPLYFYTLNSHNVVPFNEGAWSLRWSPFWVAFKALGDQKVDLAWAYAVGNTWKMPAACAILAVLALVGMVWWMRHPQRKQGAVLATAILMIISVGGMFWIGLYEIRHDPRYYGDFKPAQDLLAQLEPQLQDDDVIVLNDQDTYKYFFANYYKRREPMVLTLPPSSGERTSPEQTPDLESPNPEWLINRSDTVTLAYLAQEHDRLWLVINRSWFMEWSTRPVEWYLSRHYFPVMEVRAADTARAVLFAMTPAPPATGLWPEYSLDAMVGDSIRLVGCDIPDGTIREPGDILPVSLLWEALDSVPQDYNVALYLISPEGELVAQRDSYPVNYFERTSQWRSGSLHRDNHGLMLPDTLPPGEYELWAALYWWQTPAERLPVIGPDGESLGDHVVLAHITIQ